MRNFSFKRKVAVSLVLFSMMASASAEQLVIEDDSGKTTFYDLGSKPVITYEGGNLSVKTNFANAEFALAQVAKYYFLSDPTGTGDVADRTETFVRVSDELFQMRNGTPGTTASLLSIDGKRVGDYTVAPDGVLEIQLSGLPQGVYIIKTYSANFKFIRK